MSCSYVHCHDDMLQIIKVNSTDRLIFFTFPRVKLFYRSPVLYELHVGLVIVIEWQLVHD